METIIRHMPQRLFIKKPADFSFHHTLKSHGWYDLAPFDAGNGHGGFSYVFRSGTDGVVAAGTVRDGKGTIRITIEDGIDPAAAKRSVRHMLRLDDDIEEFYAMVHGTDLGWVADKRAGRLLRSATVFEDLVKSLCTTNCSWGLTRIMVGNLVEKLGDTSADGRKAFPTPEAMASVGPDFYRNEVKAGYRSPYFAELAEAVASGKLDPESWFGAGIPTEELKKEIKNVKGIGDYAAENLLKLLGRYDGLALDSWLRGGFFKKHNRGRKCTDKKIEKYYAKYGKWKGLAIWCDMTESWFSGS